jgi:phosphoglycolate phosphatase-like HAD superfamily hydrolase
MPQTIRRLVLFDLDSTLMRSGGAGMRAMRRAFDERFGIADAGPDIVPDGKTDPIIFREMLAAHAVGRGREELEIAALAASYEAFLREEMPTSIGAHLMPGVVELLEELEAMDGVALGLLTGNLEVTARLKLERFGLNRFFAFGAFASDHGQRDRLPPVAVARAERHIGAPIGLGAHVVIVGDTPLDVACALEHGATAAGVATGRFTVEELLAAGAQLAFEDLSDTAAVLAGLVSDPAP